MIKSFASKDTEALFERQSSRKFKNIERVALRKLTMINAAKTINDLRVPPNNRLELLKSDRKGQHSIRINDQWRICFNWNQGDAYNVEICDYH